MRVMEFSATARSRDGYSVVSVQGELDMATAPQLEEALAACNGLPVIVDCSKLAFLGSHGIRILFTGPEGERRALVVEPGSHIKRVLDLADADQRLPVFSDLEAAIEWADGRSR